MNVPTVVKAVRTQIGERLKRQSKPLPLQQPESGRLVRAPIPKRSPRLQQISLSELTGEFMGRIADGAFDSEMTVALGCQLQDALAAALDTPHNRMSGRCYRDLGMLPALAASGLLQLYGATVVDVGCGSINPYGVLFLFLMLGAQRGIAIDLDPIQDRERAVKALADCAAMMLVDPRGLVGDYPIERARVLDNIASFDLARLRAGDCKGLDDSRLLFRQDSVAHLSVGDGEVDLVLSKSFLEHVENVDEVIAELARITRIDGVGIHRIDGADHVRYAQSDHYPLEFLTDTSGAALVGGCNRIRPLDFVPLFERHGFEIVEVTPYEVIDIDPARQRTMAEPFRSCRREILGVVGAQFIVQRKDHVRETGVLAAELASGWSRRNPMAAYVITGRNLMRREHYVEALNVLGRIPPDSPEFGQAAALSGYICRLQGDYEGAERKLASAIALAIPRPELLVSRAWLRLDQGRSADALADALQARRLISSPGPLETQICGVLALCHASEGRHTEAMTLLDRLLQHVRHEPTRAFVHAWRGWAFYFAGDQEGARTAAEAARACDPHLGEIRRLMIALKSAVVHPTGQRR